MVKTQPEELVKQEMSIFGRAHGLDPSYILGMSNKLGYGNLPLLARLRSQKERVNIYRNIFLYYRENYIKNNRRIKKQFGFRPGKVIGTVEESLDDLVDCLYGVDRKGKPINLRRFLNSKYDDGTSMESYDSDTSFFEDVGWYFRDQLIMDPKGIGGGVRGAKVRIKRVEKAAQRKRAKYKKVAAILAVVGLIAGAVGNYIYNQYKSAPAKIETEEPSGITGVIAREEYVNSGRFRILIDPKEPYSLHMLLGDGYEPDVNESELVEVKLKGDAQEWDLMLDIGDLVNFNYEKAELELIEKGYKWEDINGIVNEAVTITTISDIDPETGESRGEIEITEYIIETEPGIGRAVWVADADLFSGNPLEKYVDARTEDEKVIDYKGAQNALYDIGNFRNIGGIPVKGVKVEAETEDGVMISGEPIFVKVITV